MNRHAPRPWTFDKDNFNVYSNGQLIAQTYGHIHDGERQANARLLASAPDMLDMLKTAQAALLSYQFGNKSTELAEEIATAIGKILSEAETQG